MLYNFSAGPAMLPPEVLQQAADEMLNWRGCGLSVMEMSHRSQEFGAIIEAAVSDLRELLAIPNNYKILFLQGGATAQNAIIPLNLAGLRMKRQDQAGVADYIHTGVWSMKSSQEARRYCQVNIAASAETENFARIPARDAWRLSRDAAYVHICANETINGVEYHATPDIAIDTNHAPLVADMSSQILTRAIDVQQYGVIYAGAQKNMGPAGVTTVIVREDLLGHALSICPTAFNWQTIAAHHSLYNTPPTYNIYIMGLVLRWIKRQGGIAEMERRNRAKAQLLYDYLDSTEFYTTRVTKEYRSRTNVPFFLHDESLNELFLSGAREHGLLQLKGHQSVGGMRASLYNAMPIAGVQALCSCLQEFERMHG